MSRKNLGYQKRYEHRDFSYLLKELNGNAGSVDIDGTCAVAVEPEESYVLAPRETEKRHRIMSNEKIKFLYSNKLGVIHENTVYALNTFQMKSWNIVKNIKQI